MRAYLPAAIGSLLILSACQGTVPAPTPSSAPVPAPSSIATPIPTAVPAPTLATNPTEIVSPIAPPTSAVPSSSAPVAGAQSYTLADVATHATPSDCWMVIHGTVYDASGYGAQHPGGDAVYRGCGIDATTFFDARPTKLGTPHPSTATELLPQFAIGVLAN